MADVALVGFPNVGKSTLISRISAAKPKIADYPFTTLEPNLGVVRLEEKAGDFEMVVADIPGLIEGASEGKGLGHQFLRHIERARALVILLDVAVNAPATPKEQLDVLLHELGEYRPELLTRPRIVVASKTDVRDPDFELDVPVDLEISAITGDGLRPLVGLMAEAVREARSEQAPPETFIVHRPVAEGFRIEREDEGGYRVVGRSAERAVALSDLTNLEALDEAHSRLKRLGIDKALARAGASEGDLVRIGKMTFEYDDEAM
jgi:GTP-binding protein